MRLAQNVVLFARVLRASGIPIGADKTVDAVRAMPLTGLERREDWHATLCALFLTRHEQQAIFDEAFDRFWRDPGLEERMRAALLPKVEGRTPRSEAGGRLAEALAPSRATPPPRESPPEVTVDTTLTFSASERLRGVDFEKMTSQEWDQARELVARLRLPVEDVRTRRMRAARHGGTVDLLATLRAMGRSGGEVTRIERRERSLRAPPLVILCDISGSMHRYTRIFLHFAHALERSRPRVSTLLFGTRLTNVTRPLRDRDVDEALARVAACVPDWAGGTRIAECLREFNRRWARRLLAQNATVLLVTDGLERDDVGLLAAEMRHLKRSAHRVVWLNPLLRYAGFTPVASGIAAMRPHVDAFLPMHNVASLADLAKELS